MEVDSSEKVTRCNDLNADIDIDIDIYKENELENKQQTQTPMDSPVAEVEVDDCIP